MHPDQALQAGVIVIPGGTTGLVIFFTAVMAIAAGKEMYRRHRDRGR